MSLQLSEIPSIPETGINNWLKEVHEQMSTWKFFEIDNLQINTGTEDLTQLSYIKLNPDGIEVKKFRLTFNPPQELINYYNSNITCLMSNLKVNEDSNGLTINTYRGGLSSTGGVNDLANFSVNFDNNSYRTFSITFVLNNSSTSTDLKLEGLFQVKNISSYVSLFDLPFTVEILNPDNDTVIKTWTNEDYFQDTFMTTINSLSNETRLSDKYYLKHKFVIDRKKLVYTINTIYSSEENVFTYDNSNVKLPAMTDNNDICMRVLTGTLDGEEILIICDADTPSGHENACYAMYYVFITKKGDEYIGLLHPDNRWNESNRSMTWGFSVFFNDNYKYKYHKISRNPKKKGIENKIYNLNFFYNKNLSYNSINQIMPKIYINYSAYLDEDYNVYNLEYFVPTFHWKNRNVKAKSNILEIGGKRWYHCVSVYDNTTTYLIRMEDKN